ncbi:MAG: hypothetical protein MUF42_17770 [Cytophagaceae bacterium]|nr:hypothetical protein [Cytophagaceae bacterium]
MTQEYAGNFVTSMLKNDNMDEVFKETFGRNAEDITERLLLTSVTAAAFSSVFNISQMKILQQRVEESVPTSKEKTETQQILSDAIANKEKKENADTKEKKPASNASLNLNNSAFPSLTIVEVNETEALWAGRLGKDMTIELNVANGGSSPDGSCVD